MKRVISSVAAMLLLGTTASAMAYDGFATGNVNLRAGPDIDYPVVTVIPVGAALSIQGCTEAWEWCDVYFAGMRGWVAGNYIQYEYNDRPVLLSGYGAAIGIPIVSFVITDYWGHYYRNRPFWVERERWYGHPYVRRAPPPAFRGEVHDWSRDHAGYGYGHGYGHAEEYHSPRPEYRGAPHADYHATQQVSHPAYNQGYQPQVHADSYRSTPQVHPAQAPSVQYAAPQQTNSHGNHSSSHDHDRDHDHDHGH
jgi:uncharacterized protein YraI